MIFDTGADDVDWRFVAYDVQKTAERIIALGFPAYNAQRLFPKMDDF